MRLGLMSSLSKRGGSPPLLETLPASKSAALSRQTRKPSGEEWQDVCGPGPGTGGPRTVGGRPTGEKQGGQEQAGHSQDTLARRGTRAPCLRLARLARSVPAGVRGPAGRALLRKAARLSSGPSPGHRAGSPRVDKTNAQAVHTGQRPLEKEITGQPGIASRERVGKRGRERRATSRAAPLTTGACTHTRAHAHTHAHTRSQV